MRTSDRFAIHFLPERWTPERRFAYFLGSPFRVDVPLLRGVNAVISHLEKYELLGEIAEDLIPLLGRDEQELAEAGHTAGIGGRKLGALVEAMISELYSTLDGIRQVLFSIYRGVRGVQNESTYKLFQRAAQSQYGPDFPADLISVLAGAYETWFPRFRILRSENTHGEIGSCRLDKERIKYMHYGLKENGRALIIENVVEYLGQIHQYIRQLVDWFFSSLYEKLDPVEREGLCGVYKGRIYERFVAPAVNLSFADGRCLSINWFLKEPELICPLRERCGAYSRPVPIEEFNRLHGV